MTSGSERGTVGFIGLGTMGAPMAANVARGGYHVVGLDLVAGRAAGWAREHGGTAAAGAADLAGLEVVVTMLPNGRCVRDAILDGGVADVLAPGAVVIDMSSSEPWETRSLAPELAQRGVTLLDAPVSGALQRAIDGTLTIMLGGEDEAAIERAVPVIETMSRDIFRTGPLGSGHSMKALNNYVTGAGFVATCEALVVGAKAGLDPAVMLDIMNVSSGRTFTSELIGPAEIVSRRFASGFALALLAKDVGIADELARSYDIDAPTAHVVVERLREALGRLEATADTTMALTVWERDAGVTVEPRSRPA
jgi:3-hydroxyisobutyrate dehydrogenase